MFQYQILQTNITRTVWEIVGRITNETLRFKGLMNSSQSPSFAESDTYFKTFSHRCNNMKSKVCLQFTLTLCSAVLECSLSCSSSGS